ncbi:hypothetical protein C0991_000837 [Blastosporella zonata]|nr:hypothetical protein C0991_000837 [Blastosporella zonata]
MEAKATSTKTISRGTLGLRFMQNAQRAKQLKEVEAERAPVNEDEWRVDPKIRDVWGPSSSSSNSQTISYESSYLPFLFSDEESTSLSAQNVQNPKGRRVFNKHGVEEIAEKQPEPAVTETPPDEKWLVHPRPKTISGGPGGLFGFPDQQPSKPNNAKTAKETIYDNTGVGKDLRASKQQVSNLISTPTPPAKPVFLKPAGVDEPQDTKPSPATNASSDIIQGARSKKVKRERPGMADGEEDTKRKKKKKQSAK